MLRKIVGVFALQINLLIYVAIYFVSSFEYQLAKSLGEVYTPYHFVVLVLFMLPFSVAIAYFTFCRDLSLCDCKESPSDGLYGLKGLK